jgi:hypothetical protein
MTSRRTDDRIPSITTPLPRRTGREVVQGAAHLTFVPGWFCSEGTSIDPPRYCHCGGRPFEVATPWFPGKESGRI